MQIGSQRVDDDEAFVAADDFLTSLCSPKLDPLFRRPPHIDAETAWHSHVPFANWIVAATAPRILVELGTHTGVSYLTFCNAVEREGLPTRCFAVDSWAGDKHAGFYGDDVFAAVAARHERFLAFSTLVRRKFDDALECFADGSIDLLHVDGLHTFDAVRHDFDSWRCKLSDRAVVLFHDTNERTGDFGAWRLWSDLRAQFPSFEFLHGHGLGVAATGTTIPAGVKALLTGHDHDVRATVRRRFSDLGARWLAERATLREAEHARNLQAQVQTLAAEFAAERTEKQSLAQRLDAEVRRSQEQQTTLDRALAAAAAVTRSAEAWQEEARTWQVTAAEWQDIARRARTAPGTQTALAIQAEQKTAERVVASTRGSSGARLARYAWWTMHGVLFQRLREQQAVLRRAERIAASPLFDAEWYRAHYADAGASGLSPALHFALAPRHERRNPGPQFDTAAYVERYADVEEYGEHPFLHYLSRGLAEGREYDAVAPSA